jgi:SEC10/PgrA surface exclusion-like protein/LPXTG-motif cell wall-anchored protein
VLNRKLNKELLRAAMALTIMTTAGFVTSQNVKAAVKPNLTPVRGGGNEDSAKVNLDNASTAVSNAQKAVTSATTKLTSAQSAASVASNAVSSQSTVVANASSAKEHASTAVSQAQSALDTAQAGPAISEQITSAQNKVNSQITVVSDAAVASSNARKSATSASSALSNAQSAYNSASSAVVAQSSAVSSASQALKQAQDALSNINSSVAATQLSDARTALSAAQSTFNAASAALKEKKQAQSSASSALSAAQSAASVASAALSSANVTLNSASAALDSAKSTASAAASAATSANNEVATKSQALEEARQGRVQAETSIPEFKLTDDQKTTTQNLVKAVKRLISNKMEEYAQGGSVSFGTADIQNLTEFDAWRAAMTVSGAADVSGNVNPQMYNNWVDQNSADQQAQVDLKNMTKAQVTDLSEFVAATLNKLQSDLGISGQVGKNIVTSGMISYAKEVADNYVASQSAQDGHYIYGLQNAAYDHGFANQKNTNPDDYAPTNCYGESLGTELSSEDTKDTTMAKVKNQVVSTIAGMLFNDDNGSEMGHAISMTGIDSITLGSQSNPVKVEDEYLGASSSNSVINDWNARQIHILQITPSRLSTDEALQDLGNNTYNIVQNPLNAAAVNRQAEQHMEQAINNPYESSNTSSAESSAIKAASDALSDAQSADSSANAAKSTADSAVTSAQSAFNTASQSAALAQTAANTDSNAVVEKQNALSSANSAVSSAQNELNQASDHLNEAKTAESNAQTAVNNITADRATKQQRVTEAQTAYNQANARLTSLKTDLQAKSSALATASAANDTASQAVAAANTTLNAAQDQLHTLESNLQALQHGSSDIPALQHNLNIKEDQLRTATENLTSAKNKLTDLEEQLRAATDQVNSDQTALTKAQQDLSRAQSAYQNAHDAYWTDARKYGDKVTISDVTITVGEITTTSELPRLVIKNGRLTVEETPALALFMSFAYDPSARIPAGTTANWTDPAKVLNDIQHSGDYTEDVTLNFPDHSAYQTTVKVHVKAKSTSGSSATQQGGSSATTPSSTPANPATSSATTPSSTSASPATSSATTPSSTPASPATSSATTPSEVPASSATSSAAPSDVPVSSVAPAQSGVVNANDEGTVENTVQHNNFSSVKVQNNNAISSLTAESATAMARDMSGKLNYGNSQQIQTHQQSQTQTKQLPQTGNQRGHEGTLLGLALVSFTTMFGLIKQRKQR